MADWLFLVFGGRLLILNGLGGGGIGLSESSLSSISILSFDFDFDFDLPCVKSIIISFSSLSSPLCSLSLFSSINDAVVVLTAVVVVVDETAVGGCATTPGGTAAIGWSIGLLLLLLLLISWIKLSSAASSDWMTGLLFLFTFCIYYICVVYYIGSFFNCRLVMINVLSLQLTS